MLLRDLIMRIRQTCPLFEGRVYGSAEMEEGIRQAEALPVPTAFVMVDGDFPGENLDAGASVQETQERWTIVVVVSNKNDSRGQFAADQLHEARRQLMGALLGWENLRPDLDSPDETTEDPDDVHLVSEPDWGPVVYRGGLHIEMNAARLWHQFSFGHTIVLHSGRDYECIPSLRMAFRGGITEYDNTTEVWQEAPSGDVVEPGVTPRPPFANPEPEPWPNPSRSSKYLKP